MFVSHCLKRTSNNIVQNNYTIDNNIDSLGKLYNNNIQLFKEEIEFMEMSTSKNVKTKNRFLYIKIISYFMIICQ